MDDQLHDLFLHDLGMDVRDLGNKLAVEEPKPGEVLSQGVVTLSMIHDYARAKLRRAILQGGKPDAVEIRVEHGPRVGEVMISFHRADNGHEIRSIWELREVMGLAPAYKFSCQIRKVEP